MLIDFVDLIGKKIDVELSGGNFHKGMLLDLGLDIIVIYDGKNILPLHSIYSYSKIERNQFRRRRYYLMTRLAEKPIETDVISFRKVLTSC